MIYNESREAIASTIAYADPTKTQIKSTKDVLKAVGHLLLCVEFRLTSSHDPPSLRLMQKKLSRI